MYSGSQPTSPRSGGPTCTDGRCPGTRCAALRADSFAPQHDEHRLNENRQVQAEAAAVDVLDIDECLAASAIFYPSAVEAFGYPLAEARAYGMPIINLTRDWRSGTTGISDPVGDVRREVPGADRVRVLDAALCSSRVWTA